MNIMNVDYIKNCIMFRKSCDKKCDFIFDNLDCVLAVIDDTELHAMIHDYQSLIKLCGPNQNTIDKIMSMIVKRIEQILSIQIL
jgi:hypothetical protein